MKYSTTKISPAKMNNSAKKALIKIPRVRKSQQKTKEVCQLYITQLRSGLIIDKKTYSFRKETTKSSLKTECSVSLSTYNDQSVTFAFADGNYEIYVEELGKKQGKDKVLFRYYDSKSPAQETGDHIDGHGHRLMVSLSPTKDRNFLLHANNKEHSVELQKCENPLPEQTFFFLHNHSSSSKCVSFECKSNPGVFIGVEDNHLALIKLKDQNEQLRSENIKFKLS